MDQDLDHEIKALLHVAGASTVAEATVTMFRWREQALRPPAEPRPDPSGLPEVEFARRVMKVLGMSNYDGALALIEVYEKAFTERSARSAELAAHLQHVSELTLPKRTRGSD